MNEDLKKEVAAYSERELLLDLEFSVRQHISQKKPETAARVREALARIDAKRSK